MLMRKICAYLTPSIVLEFWSQVNIRGADECWVYTDKLDGDGYGRFSLDTGVSINNENYLAHRVAWTVTNGEIPEGLLLRHTCNNPPCCNPKHLKPGTSSENILDMYATKEGYALRKGTRNGRSKLTEEIVREIKNKLMRGIKYPQLSEEYGISKCQLNKIHNGKQWGHVPYDIDRKKS